MTAPSVAAARLTAQLLSGTPARTPGQVVQRLLAVQAQDLRGGRLAVRARSQELHSSDIDRALADRELVVTWVNRGTLHLVRAEDYPWLHALTTPQLATGNASRLKQEGVSPSQAERGVAVVEKELCDGPRTRLQLKAALDAADVPTAGQAVVHVLLLATLRGVCVRGPMLGKEQAFVLVRDWLPPGRPVDRDVALAELARRYLAGHGPSTARDLGKWAGITLGDARKGLAAVKVLGDQLVDLPGREVAPLPVPRLLGPWDELLMGWASREPVLGDRTGIVTVNGIFKPIALVRGKAVGTWGLPGGKVALVPFAPLSASVSKALARDAADVERFVLPQLPYRITDRDTRSDMAPVRAKAARRRAGPEQRCTSP
ncbi:MAG: hypothetical protein JWM02_3405 [Frankiales bacterium]|nr:hypothetical protein [Frankiales bacterium]